MATSDREIAHLSVDPRSARIYETGIRATRAVRTAVKTMTSSIQRHELTAPLCIAGMHRSGTSMVARVLRTCGLYLGTDSELAGPQPDNPEGFLEHVRFVKLNDDVLRELGGAWDVPPAVHDGWEADDRLSALRAESQSLARQFEGQEHWGWKDPRNSLTLPFWKSVFGEIRGLICLRNPLDVARSLQKRGYSSDLFGFTLWHIYQERAIASTRPEERLVTHYDSYFSDPDRELRRVLDWLGMSASQRAIEQACSTVNRSLRHNRSTVKDLQRAGAPSGLVELYAHSCDEAGMVST